MRFVVSTEEVRHIRLKCPIGRLTGNLGTIAHLFG